MKLRHIILLVFVAAIWGVNFVAIKIGLKGVPPLTLSAMRFFLAAFPAIFLIKKPALPLRKLAAFGLVMFAGQFGFLFSSMQAGLSAGLASLVLQTQAFFTIGLAALFLKEKPRLFQMLGACIAAAGIGIVAQHTGGDATPLSLLLVMVAALAFGGGNVIVKSFGRVDMFGVVVWGSLFAFPPLAVIALLLEGREAVMHGMTAMHVESLLALAYIVYASTFVAYPLWNRMFALYPASMVAPFTLLVPVFGMVGAALFLGEGFPLWKLTATLFIIAGLAVNQFGGRMLQFMQARFLRAKAVHDA